MSKRAEKAALNAYPPHKGASQEWIKLHLSGGDCACFIKGYNQAEKDLAPAFEFSFDVPDNDGHIVFTPMDNMTIRKELKLKKGERIIISIRREHEKE